MCSQPFPGSFNRGFLVSLFNTHIVIKKNFLYSSGAREKFESWRFLCVMLTCLLKRRGLLEELNGAQILAGTAVMLEDLWEAQMWDGFLCAGVTAGGKGGREVRILHFGFDG